MSTPVAIRIRGAIRCGSPGRRAAGLALSGRAAERPDLIELTFLLFLKMAKETGQESQLPKGYRWADLEKDGIAQLTFYRELLVHLGAEGSPRVQAIFANATTSFRQPRNLRTVVENIDALDWYSAKSEGLGDMYEGLLERNAEETKSGAGQYFTPRPLIDCMVDRIQPQPGEVVQDPAIGTAGFLVAANRYVRARTDDLFTLPERQLLSDNYFSPWTTTRFPHF